MGRLGCVDSQNDIKCISGVLSNEYGIEIHDIWLYREMIGFIYFIKTANGRLVFKIFRSHNTPQAEQSVEIMSFLHSKGYPVPSVLSAGGRPYVNIGSRVGALLEFIPGREPDADAKIGEMGEIAARLQELMEEYPKPLISRGREFYVDRFINMLCDGGYDTSKIGDLENFAMEAWGRLSMTRRGFCHGDFHTGNMIETREGGLTLLDFDASALGFPVIDPAVICNRTDFNTFKTDDFERTNRAIDKFYKSYSTDKIPDEDGYRAIFSFIGIRHYELIATIVKSKDCGRFPGKAFLDEQHAWLMEWWNLCISKGVI